MGQRQSKTTKGGPPQPPIDPEEQKRLEKRAKISEEVVETEKSYSTSLDTCVEHVILPLHKKDSGVPVVSPEKLRKMFSNLESLNETHKRFLEAITSLIGQKNALFGPLFVEYANEFKIQYSTYVNDYNEAVTVLAKARKQNPDFDEYLEVSAREAGCQGIASIMIMPVQRLPRYVMLLQDLLKTYPDNHPDHHETKIALDTMRETTEFVNKEKRIAEQQHEIMDIQESLTSDSELLISRERFVVKRGTVRILKKEKDYHYILFNDLILFASEQRISLTSIWSNRKYTEKDRCNLLDVTLTKKDEGNNVCVLKTPKRVWIMKFRKPEEYAEWITVYEQTVAKAPRRKVQKRVLSYVLETEKTKLIEKPETEGNCSCLLM